MAKILKPNYKDGLCFLPDKSLVSQAHDERLGLGEAALAAGDDDDHADGAEEGEAGWAIHRDCDQEINREYYIGCMISRPGFPWPLR